MPYKYGIKQALVLKPCPFQQMEAVSNINHMIVSKISNLPYTSIFTNGPHPTKSKLPISTGPHYT